MVLEDTVTGEISTLEVDGAFVAIGHAPSTELFKGKLAMDDGGYLDVAKAEMARCLALKYNLE